MSAPEDYSANNPDHDHDSFYHLNNPSPRPSRRSLYNPSHAREPIQDFHSAQTAGTSWADDYLSGPYTLPPTPIPPADQYFREAYVPRSPTPPAPASYLDSILNPAGLNHNRFSPFNYHPLLPSWRPSPLHHNDMPPTTRTSADSATARSGRLSNGYVDLTATAESPPPPRRKREASESGPSAKRQRRTDGTAGSSGSPATLDIEEVDLTEEKPSVRDILRKQREDAINAQTKPEEKATTFNNFNCVICMDTPTDLTATACGMCTPCCTLFSQLTSSGHLFCHTCLMEALIAGENRSGPGEQKRSQCPVCRKFISRTKVADIIPLALKKGLATQPRRKAAA